MKVHLIINGFLLIFLACANPQTSSLNEEGSDDGALANCGRYLVPHFIEMADPQPTTFGYSVETVSLEGMDCLGGDSVALNNYSKHSQVLVNGIPVQLFVRNNNLVVVNGTTIVSERPLQEEAYGQTGRLIIPVDGNTVAQGEALVLSL